MQDAEIKKKKKKIFANTRLNCSERRDDDIGKFFNDGKKFRSSKI